MRILITGSTGFVGRTVTRRLLREGHELALLVRNREKATEFFPTGNYRIILTGDNDWPSQIKDFNPETTIHLAAFFTGRCDIESATNLIESNILFPTQLLCSLHHTGCRAFISTGTFTEYLYGKEIPKPADLYCATKAAFKPIVDYFESVNNWKWINVIVFTAYGRKNESKKVMDYMIDALGATNPVGFSDGLQVRDFIHVDDMAEFYCKLVNCIDKIPPNQELYLGSGVGYSLKDLAMEIESVFGKKINADWGKINRNLNDPDYAVAPIHLNPSIIDWEPLISLQEGLSILKNDLMDK